MMRSTQVATLSTALILALAAALPVQAESVDAARQRYQACMAKVDTRPEAAFDDATEWEGLGGGHPARHCALAALMAIGHYAEAAQGLERLADVVHADAPFKSQLLIQSARAWIAAGVPNRAAAAAETALSLNPDAPGARLIRAQALALQGAYREAADNLDQVLHDAPGDVEALVLRGAAYRQLDVLDRAQADLDRALSLAPGHPGGLLERGIVHRLSGRKAEARADWRRLIETAPESEAARAAAANLHKLDSGLE